MPQALYPAFPGITALFYASDSMARNDHLLIRCSGIDWRNAEKKRLYALLNGPKRSCLAAVIIFIFSNAISKLMAI